MLVVKFGVSGVNYLNGAKIEKFELLNQKTGSITFLSYYTHF